MDHARQNTSNAIFTAAEIRNIEQLAAAAPDRPALMEKAGLATAEVVRDRLLIGEKHKVLVLAGPGNNGGDAFVAARHLRIWGFEVTLVFTGERASLPMDAQHALDAWLAQGGEILTGLPENGCWDGVVDGLFGIGLDHKGGRDLAGKYLELVRAVNRMSLPVLAIDVPSGLGSDTGNVRGDAIHARVTVTFIGLKPGLLTARGPEYCGEIVLRDLGLDAPSLLEPNCWMMDRAHADELLLPPRAASSHKGMFGSIGIIGGAQGMVGAALLAGTAALKLGAGRVYLGLLADDAPKVDTAQPELMLRPVAEVLDLDNLNCLVIGPGLGMAVEAGIWLRCALDNDLPLVVDADALNLIASQPRLASRLRERSRKRKVSSILTPHPAEAARLLGTDTSAIESDRLNAAISLAGRYGCLAVLKGAGSISAMPSGQCYINASGNPGLSSAGTGDILSGMIGALLAQGLEPEKALLLGVHLHGAAADVLREQHGGPVGMTASEIPDAARRLLNQWVYSPRNP
ncbi:MAG TPA: NAD(P)H-hydrate dehydratase [Nitrosospira sp.]|nr:NAD(P)H-hydrate dehydratase [Nitrosospira sp.]